LLAIRQRGHAGALERGGMHEHVPAAVVRLDETEALLGVEEFYNTILHGITFSHVYAGMRDHSRPISRMRPDLSKVLKEVGGCERLRRDQPECPAKNIDGRTLRAPLCESKRHKRDRKHFAVECRASCPAAFPV